MKKVIFDGKEMEVLNYDEDFGTVEVPVILSGLTGQYCPLNSQLDPIVAIMQGELIVEDDTVDSAALVVWASISIFCLFAFHLCGVIFGELMQ